MAALAWVVLALFGLAFVGLMVAFVVDTWPWGVVSVTAILLLLGAFTWAVGTVAGAS